MALNRSLVLCTVKGNDLNHLVEGNQASLFRSIVFELITRPCPLPPPHTNIFYISNIKALALVISDKKVPSCFPRWVSAKHVAPGGPILCPRIII